jgi:hypothetical protein
MAPWVRPYHSEKTRPSGGRGRGRGSMSAIGRGAKEEQAKGTA